MNKYIEKQQNTEKQRPGNKVLLETMQNTVDSRYLEVEGTL